MHPQSATEPALAACAAGRQGKFDKMEELIWTEAYAVRDFSQGHLEGLAKKAKLKMSRYKADRDGVCKKIIAKDQQEMKAVGTSGTPAFYINGRFLSGARPISQFKTLIDEELKKANDRIKQGEASKRDYYEKFVVKAGLKKLES